MAMAVQNDFIANWNGNCFFCWKPVLPRLAKIESQIYSLQCLSRYLQIDMSKVFSNEELISPHLLTKVKKSKLKVELCPECASMNGKLSEQYRQLEKLEMDMISGLERIVGKLLGGPGMTTSETKEPDMTTESEFSLGKLQIVKALRKETMQRGLDKLNSSFPKICIQNLTTNQVICKKNNIKQNSYLHLKLFPESSKKGISLQEVSISNVKVESPFEDSVKIDYDEDEGKSYSNHDHLPESGGEILEVGEVFISKVKVESSLSNSLRIDDGKESARFDESSHSTSTDNDPASTSCTMPPKLEKTDYGLSSLKLKYTFSSETGIHSCRECSKKFSTYRQFYLHYRAVHVKIKYECSICGHTCSDIGNFNRHQKNTHKGVKYKCQVCNQIFPLESNLIKHRGPNGCDAIVSESTDAIHPPKKARKRKAQDFCSLIKETGRVKCSLCATEVASVDSFRVHYKSIHQKVRYKCALCEKEFGARSNYARHRKNVHLKCPTVKKKCPVCKKEFSSKQHCDRHQKTAHLGIKFKCKECGKSFKWEAGFKRHLQTTSCGKSGKQGDMTKSDTV